MGGYDTCHSVCPLYGGTNRPISSSLFMSRKPKKGYFVKGMFVAEGSELDLELKAELRGTEGKTRTDRKKDSDGRQELGVELLTLRNDLTERLHAQGHMTDLLREALAEAQRITNFEGKRRQMQYIGKLMRKLDEADVAAMREALEEQRTGHGRETMALHEAELWRDRLVQDDQAVAQWMAAHPGTDSQQLRALVRQARKDGLPDKTAISQGLLPRHGRAYREIFQLVKAQLSNAQDGDAPQEDETEPS